MSRIYGNIEEVDSEKIKKFFNNRAKKDEEALLVKTEFSDKENVEKRHKEDRSRNSGWSPVCGFRPSGR